MDQSCPLYDQLELYCLFCHGLHVMCKNCRIAELKWIAKEIWQAASSYLVDHPSLSASLRRADDEHAHEYVNRRASSNCNSPARASHKVFCLLPAVFAELRPFWQSLWSRAEGSGSTGVPECHFPLLTSTLSTQEKWPMSADAPSLSVLGASSNAPMPSFFAGYNAGIKTCHLPRWQAARGATQLLPLSQNTHILTHF